MKIIRVNVVLAFAAPDDADPEGFAPDAANELLREHQRSFAPLSSLLDYTVGDHDVVELPTSGTGYQEGDAFFNAAILLD